MVALLGWFKQVVTHKLLWCCSIYASLFFKIYNGDTDTDKGGKFGGNFATIYPDIIRLYGY